MADRPDQTRPVYVSTGSPSECSRQRGELRVTPGHKTFPDPPPHPPVPFLQAISSPSPPHIPRGGGTHPAPVAGGRQRWWQRQHTVTQCTLWGVWESTRQTQDFVSEFSWINERHAAVSVSTPLLGPLSLQISIDSLPGGHGGPSHILLPSPICMHPSRRGFRYPPSSVFISCNFGQGQDLLSEVEEPPFLLSETPQTRGCSSALSHLRFEFSICPPQVESHKRITGRFRLLGCVSEMVLTLL